MKLISKGITIFGDYLTELWQFKNGRFGVWIIPWNRLMSDSETARFERLSGDDWQTWVEAHKRRPA